MLVGLKTVLFEVKVGHCAGSHGGWAEEGWAEEGWHYTVVFGQNFVICSPLYSFV